MIPKDFLASLLGLDLPTAEKTITSYSESKLTFRIAAQDGEGMALTGDLVEGRINLELSEGKVSKASEG